VQYTKGAKYLQKNLPFHGGKAHGGSGYMQILSLEIAAFHFPGGFDFDRSSSLVHCEKKGCNTTVRHKFRTQLSTTFEKQ
jgi:hypothetical protein